LRKYFVKLSSSGFGYYYDGAEVGVRIRIVGEVVVETSNRRDLSSTCVLRPRLLEQVSLNFGKAEERRS
jgi:hypothetical protein